MPAHDLALAAETFEQRDLTGIEIGRDEVGTAQHVEQFDHAARITLLGAVDQVTPTMTSVTMDGCSMLVDCGIRRFGDPLPDAALAARTLLLTHAHNDHVSGLGSLVPAGGLERIVATAPTLEIAKRQVKDGLRLNHGTDRDYHVFSKRFDEIAVKTTYGATVHLDSTVTARFVEAGHILGSASIELRSKKSRVIISGDLGRPGSPILKDFNTDWADDRPVDLVLMEATYGDREQPFVAADLTAQLEKSINHALKDGGHILVPSFAIGRTQVLLYLLNDLVESGRIPSVPVAVDTPMGLAITDTYKKFERLYDRDYMERLESGDDPIDFDNLFAVQKARDSYKLDDTKESMLIIAGSGMCTGGRILHHLIALLPKPETDVIFVGHQAKGTPGHQLQQLAAQDRTAAEPPTIVLDGETVPVRANIMTLKGISAHADRNELGHWFRAIPDVRSLALHHGARLAQESLRDFLCGL